jgi:hypothetical protein
MALSMKTFAPATGKVASRSRSVVVRATKYDEELIATANKIVSG